MRHNTDAMRGFTLIELMVTLAVMLIVLMFASGPFGALLARNKLTATVNDFVATLSLARSMAVKGEPTTICIDNNGACGTGTDWSNGALIFTDANANKVIDGTDAIKRRLDATANIIITSNVAAVTYGRDGGATMQSATTNSKWLFCDSSGRAEPRIVAVSGVGSNYLFKPATCSF